MPESSVPPPLLSVITVCFNAAATLPATIESLRCQAPGVIEYVVVDGGSQDGTLAVLKEASDVIDRWRSEPDGGIYDAMNRGIQLARGEYVHFLNADDCLVDDQVLADVARALRDDPELDLLYGNAVCVGPGGHRSRQSYPHVTSRNLVFANLCHQAVFARRSLFDRLGGFNLAFRIVADLDWLVRALQARAKHRWIDRDICLYATDGFSAQQIELRTAEKHRLQVQLHGRWGAIAGRWRYRIARKLRSLG